MMSLSTFIGFSACKFILRMDRHDCIDPNFNIKLMFTCRWFHQGPNPYTGAPDWLYTGGYWDRNHSHLPDIYWPQTTANIWGMKRPAAQEMQPSLYYIWVSVLVLHHDYDDTVKFIMTYSKSTRSTELYLLAHSSVVLIYIKHNDMWNYVCNVTRICWKHLEHLNIKRFNFYGNF